MRPNESLAVVIVAKNEAARIGDCIASASFADEIVMLDSGSTDRTAQIAEGLGARVVVTDWPGYGAQVARGFALARSDWVLSLDADERVPPALQREIRAAIARGEHDGFRIPRWSEFCGRVMHHGGWRPDRTLRLGRRAKAGFTSDFHSAAVSVPNAVTVLLRMRPTMSRLIIPMTSVGLSPPGRCSTNCLDPITPSSSAVNATR